ncbi:MAG: hypothetical protein RLZZ502_410 [Pseudomonadota bacterium]
MVTQVGRADLARLAMGDFKQQTHPRKELLIVVDEGEAAKSVFEDLARTLGMAEMCRVLCAPKSNLGALRNFSMRMAEGTVLAQWDDDDRYHPLRLSLQWEAMCQQAAQACFLTDQWHYFSSEQSLFWCDWSQEPYPLNFVQGTMLVAREVRPSYPELKRGEDTALCWEMIRAQVPIARVRDQGWCYTYVYHGANVWERSHHQAIVRAHALGPAAMQNRAKLMQQRWSEYKPGFAIARP